MFWAKSLAHLLALSPIIWLVYGIFNRQLGGDPQEVVLHELGSWGLIWLLLGLSLTPLKHFIKVIPWIRFRRLVGLYAAFYISLHLLAYIAFTLAFDFSELLNEIIKRPYITVGMLAFIGLLPLAITSTKAMQRKLGRQWKKLHQLVYPVAGLGLVHYVWQSKSDLNEPLIYISWGVLLIAARYFIKRKKQRAAKQNQISNSTEPTSQVRAEQ